MRNTKDPMPPPEATPEEIGEFWDTHSLADYWEETHEVEMEVNLVKHHKYAHHELRKLKMIELFSMKGKDGAYICKKLFANMRKNKEDIDDVENVCPYGDRWLVWTLDRVYMLQEDSLGILIINSVARHPIAGSIKINRFNQDEVKS